MKRPFLALLILVYLVATASAASTNSFELNFSLFLKEYLKQSPSMIRARQSYAQAVRNTSVSQDVTQGEFSATPTLSHETRNLDSIPPVSTYNRALDFQGQYQQNLSTGTQVRVRGQEFIEQSNPLFQAYDRIVSVGLSQDLYNNGFGYSQKRRQRQGRLDALIARQEFRTSQIQVCEEAFNLYSDAYVQQQRWQILQEQMKDAKKALASSRKLYRQKLIHRVDLLSSESDFIQTKNDVEQAQQILANGRNQLAVYLKGIPMGNEALDSPARFVAHALQKASPETLAQTIAKNKIQSANIEVERVRSDARNNLDLGFEIGKREGRRVSQTGFNPFTEDYVSANLKFTIPTFNKTNPANLNLALERQRNSILEKELTARSQKTLIENLSALVRLYRGQVTSSEQRLKLLKEKEKIAYKRMRNGRMEFENYLLHRNAFRNHQMNHLQLLQNLWSNEFSVHRELTDENSIFCSA